MSTPLINPLGTNDVTPMVLTSNSSNQTLAQQIEEETIQVDAQLGQQIDNNVDGQEQAVASKAYDVPPPPSPMDLFGS